MRSNFLKVSMVASFILMLVLASVSAQVQASRSAQATNAAASTTAPTSTDGGAYPPCPDVVPQPTAAATMSGTAAAPMAMTMSATTAATTAATMAGTPAAAAMKVEPFKTMSGCTLVATLAGSNEVPKAGPDKSGGDALLIVLRPETGPGTICFVLEHVHGIKLPATAAHIHAGAAGVAGPVVVPFSPPGVSGQADGCTTGVDRALITQILTTPYNFYVNVHNADFPAGAVRGQIESQVGS